jgi:prepilin-type N-terminal cleavage/methylation domain-containing protein
MIILKKLINEKGMTLVEVLLAVAILSIVSVPVINLFVKAVEHRGHTMNQNRANYIAEKFIEKEKSLHKKPLNGEEEYEYEGFTVKTSYVDKTDLLSKTPAAIDTLDNSIYENSDFFINIIDDDKLEYSSFSGQETELNTGSVDSEYIIINVNKLRANTFNITANYDVSGVPTETPLGTVNVKTNSNIGINFTSSSENNKSYNFKVFNKTDKTVEVHIIDDEHNKIMVTGYLSTYDGTVKIIDGLITKKIANTNESAYYDLIVRVFKNDVEYATVITTISVK